MLSRWLHLTKTVLPGLSTASGWPIRYDHCFMRVCLDMALGCRWDTVVKRPATRHLAPEQLARAVAIAESVVNDPASLPALNRRSLAMRAEAAARRPLLSVP